MGELHTTIHILVHVVYHQSIHASDTEQLTVKTEIVLTFNSHD